VRAARTAVGAVKAGDWIGLSRRGIEVVGDRLASVAAELIGRLIEPGQEIVTLIAGEGAEESELEGVEAFLASAHPDLVVERVDGGQPLYPLLISIE
jgi:dihydroxyacetone kinase-like predicted kinase